MLTLPVATVLTVLVVVLFLKAEEESETCSL